MTGHDGRHPRRRPSPAERAGLVERDGRWELPFEDGTITQLQIDFALGLTIDQWVHIRIETSFDLILDGVTTTLDPSATASLGPALALHQRRVEVLVALKDGPLTLRLSDGGRVRVPSHPDFEAYTVAGNRKDDARFTLVALPGTGLAEFCT